jgi:hypothetical protein
MTRLFAELLKHYPPLRGRNAPGCVRARTPLGGGRGIPPMNVVGPQSGRTRFRLEQARVNAPGDFHTFATLARSREHFDFAVRSRLRHGRIIIEEQALKPLERALLAQALPPWEPDRDSQISNAGRRGCVRGLAGRLRAP